MYRRMLAAYNQIPDKANLTKEDIKRVAIASFYPHDQDDLS